MDDVSETHYMVTGTDRYIQLPIFHYLCILRMEAFDSTDGILSRRSQFAVLVRRGLLESLKVLIVLRTYFSCKLPLGGEWVDKTVEF